MVCTRELIHSNRPWAHPQLAAIAVVGDGVEFGFGGAQFAHAISHPLGHGVNAAASWPTSSSESTPTRPEDTASHGLARGRETTQVAGEPQPQSELENDGDYDRGSRDHQAAAQQTGTSSVQERCGDGVAQQSLALTGEDERDLRVEAAVGFEIGGRCAVLQRRKRSVHVPALGGDGAAVVVQQDEVAQAVFGSTLAQNVTYCCVIALRYGNRQRGVEHRRQQPSAYTRLLYERVLEQS